MRDSRLDPLFAEATALPGVGPKVAKALTRLLGAPPGGDVPRVIDVLFHAPTGGVDRRTRSTIADMRPGETTLVEAVVERHQPPRSPRAPYRVVVADGTGAMTLVFFRAKAPLLEHLLPVGATRWIAGAPEMFDGMPQMVHPAHVLDADGLARLPPVEPTYPLVEGLTHNLISRLARAALERLPALPEWLDGAFLAQRGFAGFAASLNALHRPARPEELAPEGPALTRLAYDELFANQLALQLVRAHMKRARGRASVGDDRVTRAVLAALPFQLTGAQERALDAIRADLAADARMLRLLQGDVGSGKTVVALLAAAVVIEAGRQAALMAPTEILARQHLATLEPLAEKAGVRLGLLTGREKGRERAAVLERLAAGQIDLLIGTHALFQDDVAFRDLALAVMDEQHKFGVRQRLALAAKGAAVDVLVMTATPIPRTLALTAFGDMDQSALDEKPPGRTPIDTRLVSLDRLEETIAAIGRAIDAGARVYWVCPLVEQSETLDVAAAQDRFAELSDAFPGRVGLVHGKMKAAEKDSAVAAFVEGRSSILVATTVIEVGVNVPEATIMVIEHAERFGLAQLHQLRGRVGRGAERSTCLLLWKGPLGETAKARLETLRDTDDGFVIAEKDLELRGEGEVLGARQSGMAVFRFARMEVHGELARIAHQDAGLILATDPNLAGERGEALRLLLHLFERDAAVRLLRAG
ncbi:ATP-dependent DNA helicase RecG [Methylopila jiangsuensis]|uniref:ATP-dependent DNA helicase RecG n=1 Tax=Methylopila jiangsuensis TaxID=586230 RepID=A0A9W6JGI2_9HYPH|nr:ATP-dependent DNA helicase RecG [Methylopila jiangsuensis]MDR6286469.1 ATP-dependent DNA helicase RecG [Methylopila jiangsuensis]GLK77191.1 ATP-dependent DNA helicase RecG [Methylopila jiangsuensis]